jgi:hypothetical protein
MIEPLQTTRGQGAMVKILAPSAVWRFWLVLAVLLAGPPVAEASGPPPDMPITAADRAAVVSAAAEQIDTFFYDAEQGRRIAAGLNASARKGEFDQATTAMALVRSVNARLKLLSGDQHLNLGYDAALHPSVEPEETPETAERYRLEAAAEGYGVLNASIPEAGIGYVKLARFYDPVFAAVGFDAAMTLVERTDTLIIDLRGTGGGSPQSVALLMSYFFSPEPRLLFSIVPREPAKAEQFWTVGALSAPRYLGKRIVLLTDERTYSAAEGFASHMRAFGKAVIIGAPTRGGVHPARWHTIHPHFAIQVPEFRGVNALGGEEREGQGVQPDIVVPPETALTVAMAEARKMAAATP